MNIYPISSTNESVTNQGSTIYLQIEQQDTPMLLSFLLSKQISFELIYQPVATSPQNSPVELQPTHDYIPKENSSFDFLQKLTAREKIEWAFEYYIQKKFHQTIPSENEIAAQLEMAASQFRTLFKRTYGKGFYQFYLSKRMEYACKLLRKGLKCNEVAKMVGYGNSSAIKFNKMFQKHFGVTPKKYQLEHC